MQASSDVVARYTPYEANTYKLELAKSGVKILVDPWFYGPLVFVGQTWFFQGEKPGLRNNPDFDVEAVCADVDIVLVAQVLDDHCHRPTLERLPKHIPIVAQPGAAKVCSELGFQTVHSLDHHEQLALCGGKLQVRATLGAKVGPPWSKRQNGWHFAEEGGVTVYYEPHANHDLRSVKSVSPVDVAIIPTESAYAAGYAVVEGQEGAPQLIDVLQPKALVPFRNNTAESKGLLAKVLKGQGSSHPDDVKRWMAQRGHLDLHVIGPQEFGKALDVTLQQAAVHA